ncbi:MAG: hypothetical protein CMP34_03120 [Rickettsiales bacterium]|nr:hypothetical protein [Rickettsiales bacterium]|tara:strand:- start:716 stop:1042 length:327 start_codon:yes stop_codon:yes gene_type:complete
MLKRNSKSYKTILTLIVTFFISGYQLAISNTLINLHDENICKSEDNFNKNNLKCLSHCILDINSDCNPESLFYVTKLDKFVFLCKRKLQNLNFIKIDPKSNSPPFFIS